MYAKLLILPLLAAILLPAHAATHQATHMSVTGGTFTAYDPASSQSTPMATWSNTQNPGANLVGGYVNLGEVSYFFGLPMYLFTGDGSTSPYAATGTPPWGGPVPSAALDDTAHTITANLSALTWSWSLSLFSQGNPDAQGTWDPSTGVYHLAWESPFALGYNFDGLVGMWTMTGVAAIPEPATYAMLLTGIGLVSAAIRRKTILIAAG